MIFVSFCVLQFSVTILVMYREHRNLVNGFFRSASGMLRENGEIHVNHKTKWPFCCWNLEELASQNSLVLIDRVPFKTEDYPGYNNKRGSGPRCDEPFRLGECCTFKFVFVTVTSVSVSIECSRIFSGYLEHIVETDPDELAELYMEKLDHQKSGRRKSKLESKMNSNSSKHVSRSTRKIRTRLEYEFDM